MFLSQTDIQVISANIFWFPKKMVMPNSGLAGSESLTHIIQVQNVDGQNDCVSNSVQRLVCHDLPQGHIFSHRNSATIQEVPEVRFWGQSQLISSSSIQPSLVTPHIYKMHGCSSASVVTPGIRILNYIDDLLIVAQSQELVL